MRKIGFIILLLLLFIPGCRDVPGKVSISCRANEVPQAHIDMITPAEAFVGEAVSFKGHGEDTDGKVVAFKWYSDLDGELSLEPEFQINSLSPGTHVISFQVEDNNGAWSKEATQTMVVTFEIIPLPLITLFTANPPSITAGGSTLLTWEVSNADTVEITPDIGAVSASGTHTVSPDRTTSYTLTAANSHGTMSTHLTISLNGQGGLGGLEEVVLYTVPDEDGSLVKYSSSYEKQNVPCAGDNSINLASRAFLSFDISSIPRDATIVEALLDLSDCTVTGDPTYVRGRHGNMGALEVYHYQYGSYDGLDMSAYNKAAQLTQGGSHQEYPLDPWRWDIKDSSDGSHVIQELVQTGASRCQLRIQFFTSTNWDGIADMICFEHAALFLRYRLP